MKAAREPVGVRETSPRLRHLTEIHLALWGWDRAGELVGEDVRLP
jgi:hypothetical protein